MKKTLIISSIIVVVAAAGYFFYQTQNDVADLNPTPTPTPTLTPPPTPVTINPVAAVGEHCGGNMTTALKCQEGYVCTPTAGSHLPFGDVGGTCVKQSVSGGINGQALLGPTCPVMRNPPEPQCADKPYQGSFAVTSTDGKIVVKEFSTDLQGMFSINLPAGDYSIRSASTAKAYPRCSNVALVHVDDGKFTTTAISCDSGIR